MRPAFLLVLALLTAVPAQAELDSFGLGSGRDGSPVFSSQGQVINSATPLTASVTAGSTVLQVEGVGALVPQSLVLIHQSIGFPSTTASGGATSVLPGAVGRWELARVASVSAELNTLTLTAPLAYGYTAPGAQAVRVPEYANVIVSTAGSLAAPPWDGRSGGILAFLAAGPVLNDGTVSADGAGFRGGAFANHVNSTGCTGLDVSPEQGGAYKGEGVVVGRHGAASGRGHLVNGGGGGNCHNSGGGGGGHGNVGGAGGRTASDVDGSRIEGGLGGAFLKYSLVDQAVFGGGGGAGEGDDGGGSGGAAGGGFVLVRAATVAGSGRFSANGVSLGHTPGADGAGGGGAGGSVIVRAAGGVTCGAVQAQGGTGGSVKDALRLLGPGGGGSGGYVLVQGSAVSCPLSVTGGAAGTVDFDDTSHGAGAGGLGVTQQYNVPYQTPTTPTITAPANGAVGVEVRPTLQGTADPGVRVLIFIDGVEVIQLGSAPDGQYTGNYPSLSTPLSAGEHRMTVVTESLGAYSARSDEVTFSVAATLADGGVLVAPILVVPVDGETVGPTPLFAGVSNGVTVGIEVDDGPEITVPVDGSYRFRYQVPAESPLAPGPHFVRLHAHTEAGDTGPYSPNTRFETLAADAGSGPVVDAGTGAPDGGFLEVPVLVVPAEGEVVDSTPLFAGAAAPGASVAILVDDVTVATVVADAAGAFRHPVPADQALTVGTHTARAQVQGSVAGASGAASAATRFEVRGPSNLDVGCGCGASPVGVAGGWALLVALAAAARRRAR